MNMREAQSFEDPSASQPASESGVQSPLSTANPRKRPHDQETSSLTDALGYDGELQGTHDIGPSHLSKKSRVADWPLRYSTDSKRGDSLEFPRSRSKRPSPRQKSQIAFSLRPSKFVEGSLSDKPSQKPPDAYIGEDEAMEQYSNNHGAGIGEVDVVYDAGIENTKPSTMYRFGRFGKAIANAFKYGIWKEKDDRGPPEKNALDVQQAKAVAKYAELKKSGYKGTRADASQREVQNMPNIRYEDRENSRQTLFRDSAIDVEEHQLSNAINDQSTVLRENIMPPQTGVAFGSVSSFSEACPRRKSSLHLRTPSLQSLKRVSSQIQLPSIKRQSVIPSVPYEELETSTIQNAAASGLRRQPSKKEIAKQYRLSKKVSDLEGKLETARRDLEMSMQDIPPVPDLPHFAQRKPFKPGALASLPSERILKPQGAEGHTLQGKEIEQLEKEPGAIDYATRTELADEATNMTTPQAASQLCRELAESVEPNMTLDKPPSEVATSKNVLENSSIERQPALWGGEAATDSITKRTSSRRKHTNGDDNFLSQSLDRVKKRQPKVPSKTPQSSPRRDNESVPIIPASFKAFDPSKVNQGKLMAMRTTPDCHVSFGRSPEDVANLRKEFPSATERQLIEYIADLLANNKTTKHISILHPDRPESPFLGRPRSMSPRKATSKVKKRGISPPPPSVSSAKKNSVQDDTVPASRNKENIAKVALKANSMNAKVAKVHTDKPLPDIQKEDFQWPEDVF